MTNKNVISSLFTQSKTRKTQIWAYTGLIFLFFKILLKCGCYLSYYAMLVSIELAKLIMLWEKKAMLIMVKWQEKKQFYHGRPKFNFSPNAELK